MEAFGAPILPRLNRGRKYGLVYLVSARKLPIFLKSSFAVNLSYPLSPGIIKTGDIFQKNVP
jgi:hypothetical protein